MKTTRRNFLKHSALAPAIVSASTLGIGSGVAANERIGLATIGVGNRGIRNQRGLAADERVQLVAVCDVDRNYREAARNEAGLPPEAAYGDFRKVLAREDVDAVMVATPDHWHALVAIEAVRSGKDVYCEKPLTSSIGEGRFLSDLVRQEKRVLQCGTQRRSMEETRRACELVRNGYIGTVKHVEVAVRGAFNVRGGYTGLEPTQPVPPELDYEMWQGPAPAADYTAGRVHFNFRWVNAYAPGYITDWGVHFVDVVQWALGMDTSGPVAVEVREQNRRAEGIYNAPESFWIDYRYANGTTMSLKSETDSTKWGIRFLGSEGTIFTEGKRLEVEPASLENQKLADTDVHLYESTDHYRNFIDCVFSRKDPVVNVETGHRSASACYLGAIAADLEAPLEFDPDAERFINSDAANQRLTKVMRAPWKMG